VYKNTQELFVELCAMPNKLLWVLGRERMQQKAGEDDLCEHYWYG